MRQRITNLFAGAFARESVVGPLVTACFVAVGARVSFLRLIDNPELRDGITAAIVLVLGGAGARQMSYSPATHGEQVAAASVRTVQDLDPSDLVQTPVVPLATEPKVLDIATGIVGQTGGVAGKLAEQAATSILQRGSEMITGRLRRGILRKG